jgi:hypothetical protein
MSILVKNTESVMTRDEAIEKCAKAMARNTGYSEDNWRNIGTIPQRAQELVACLIAFDLLPVDK